MPLKLVALVGRFGGFMFYFLDVRHRRVAVNNLLACLCNSHSKKEIISIARENFCRIGEVYFSALKTAAIPSEKIWPVLSSKGEENISLAMREDGSLPSFLLPWVILAILNCMPNQVCLFLDMIYQLHTAGSGSRGWSD